MSPASTSRGPVKRAKARITVQPSPSNRSWLSTGAISAITAATWSFTAREIHLRLDAATPRKPAPLRLGRLGRRDQRLRRHAARVQAVAAHLARLDQHDARAHLHGPRRDRQAARPGADHADVRLDPLHSTIPFRKAFSTIGSAARAASPRSGNRTGGVKMMPRSGVSPRAKTSPRPEPTEVKTRAPGMMPRKVDDRKAIQARCRRRPESGSPEERHQRHQPHQEQDRPFVFPQGRLQPGGLAACRRSTRRDRPSPKPERAARKTRTAPVRRAERR